MKDTSTALITGGSAGLGRAVALALAERGWQVIITGRHTAPLERVAAQANGITTCQGDVTDARHRERLRGEIAARGRLDLLLNNASALGPSPMPALARYPEAELTKVFATNVLAPLALISALLEPVSRAGGAIVNVSSDAAVEAYEGWGGYGAAKAALDHATAVLAVEHPRLSVYAFDPGDMRTAMHQAAFPGEDISDRPEPEAVVPALMWLLDTRPASGRYRAADLLTTAASS
ncbi:SDR family NAD(P)-dependent oxidoreductase [Rhodococcus maanshanensis]|uniref:SDR family NAD(P)-dependent oxidoreductase n=1 Tax=Rhodococcus maanshanensis TaxID=183556 RepID=UPI0022B56C89|nr:SDR family NAD(P)-dependent oxidoreductase [Rhodococcus maanshanensis]MCZ4554437.1 SDR family NAD(P)-dependent oxidoreductase [Rhodococcus maanshanensis]